MNLGLTSMEFIFLFPIVVLAYYLVPGKVRKYYLLVINLLFYASFGYKYLMVLLLEAVIAWGATKYIERSKEKGRTCILITAIVVSILVMVLGIFKVGAVISDSIVAPLGVSFYTLQAVSYIIDVKRGIVEPERNILKLITFLSFFPTITSGPIYRYGDFSRYNNNIFQIRPEYERIINGIVLMLYGYFMKLVIAGRAGIAVDAVFESFNEKEYGCVILALCAVLYSIQIYTDFAGYSAIVIGAAQILGFIIPENFIAPYMSVSVKEFWGRWHISLSTWLRDYIYIPLGGNRKGRLRKYINIMITFVVSGLWHGLLGWHFVIWGCLHGIYQVAGDITSGLRKKILPYIGIVEGNAFHRAIKRIGTFALVTIAWIFFRTGVKNALTYIRKIFVLTGFKRLTNEGFEMIGLTSFDWVIFIIALMIVLITDILQYRRKMRFDEIISSQGTFARCLTVICISLFILIFGIYGDQHDASYFIYRNF